MSATHLRAVEPPDPARERLRDAINTLAATERAVDEVRQAHQRLYARSMAASRRLREAQAVIAEAHESGQKNRLGYLMGDASAVGARRVEELKRDVDAAAAEESTIAGDRRLLDDEIARRNGELRAKASQRDDAVAEVLRPSAEAMLAEIRALRQRAATLEHALSEFPPGTFEFGFPARNVLGHGVEPDKDFASRITAAAAKLAVDADAEIPSFV